MALSSNSIIHFTNQIDSLEGILKSGFHPRFCKEAIDFGLKKLDVNAPMVSFCDIPLSQIKEHIGKYGDYGIGLSKEWAQTKGLNPVLYLDQKSYLSKSIFSEIKKAIINGPDDGAWSEEEKQALDVLRYLKNYQADLVRKGETTPNYRFSDEREWRYVPPQNSKSDFLFGSGENISSDEWKEVNSELDEMRLVFHPNDIKYLIIKNESEISQVINFLRSDMGGKYNLHDIERLTTRILTTDQIKSDV